MMDCRLHQSANNPTNKFTGSLCVIVDLIRCKYITNLIQSTIWEAHILHME